MRPFLALLFILAIAGGLRVAHGRSLAGVQAAVFSLPLFHEDRAGELAETKQAQLKAIADATERHAKGRELRAFVLAWGWHESTFSLRIMAGRCKPLECDRGLARGSHQEHRNGRSQADWDRLHGLENIDFQIASATRRAAGMLAVCGSVEGAFRAMTGRGCRAPLPGVEKRVATFEKIRRSL